MTELPFDMPPQPASFETRGGWLVNRLVVDLNLTLEQAGGIVGNLGFESGEFKILQEIHPVAGRGGYGWAQWTGPRRREFEKWCVVNHLSLSSDEANYGFLLAELTGQYRHTIDALKKTKTDAEAVFSVGQTYERPGGTTATHLPGFDQRLRYARRAIAGAKQASKGKIAMSDLVKLPPPPDPLVVQQIAGQIRALLPLIGGIVGTLGITLPALTDSQLSSYVSTTMVLFALVTYAWTAIWSYRQKVAAEQRRRESEVSAAVASANATVQAGRAVPVTVTVTPPGQDNVATVVPWSEIAAAPSVPADVAPDNAPRAVA